MRSLLPLPSEQLKNRSRPPRLWLHHANPLPPEKVYKDLRDGAAAIPQIDSDRFLNSRIEKLLPSVLVEGKNVFPVTTQRIGTKRHAYPKALVAYFAGIQGRLQQIFGGSLIADRFSPQTESEQVIFELQVYKDDFEPFLNYEFPHPEIRGSIRREIVV